MNKSAQNDEIIPVVIIRFELKIVILLKKIFLAIRINV